jgi:signal transduction histidine kinase
LIAFRSLEFRLTAWYSLILLASYVLFGIGIWLVASRALLGAVDEFLEERLTRLEDVVNAETEAPEETEEELVDFLLGIPEGHLSRVLDEEGVEVFPPGDGAAVVPWQESGFHTVGSGPSSYRVLAREVELVGSSFRVLLASSLTSLAVVRDRLLGSLLFATPIALLLCTAGGLWIARRALAPLHRIADAASDVTVSSLSRRIDVPETGDALERLARTLNEMLARIETSVDRIEQFTADASHELRTPLSVIRTTVELALRHGSTADECRKDLETIHRETESLTGLIEVLLMLSRRGVEGASVPMAEVDLREVCRDACELHRTEAESKGLRLELERPEEAVRVQGNAPALNRLVASLLENALAHTPSGSITVRVHPGAEIVVEDTGEGIPAESLERIFDRFFRVDSSRSRSSGRLGLGLSIARRIAELHGAEIAVRSRVGEGSCFTVRFPR